MTSLEVPQLNSVAYCFFAIEEGSIHAENSVGGGPGVGKKIITGCCCRVFFHLLTHAALAARPYFIFSGFPEKEMHNFGLFTRRGIFEVPQHWKCEHVLSMNRSLFSST